MTVTVDTRTIGDKITILSENVTITYKIDIDNLQRQNKIDEVNRIIAEYGLTLRGTII